MAFIPKRKGNRNRVSTSTAMGRLISSRDQSEETSSVSMSSAPSRLIWTNEPPSEHERAEIVLAISHAEKQKDELKPPSDENDPSEVARVQRSLTELDAFINTHKPILSPLRLLPFDVLSYIFALCLEPIRTRPWSRTHWYTIPSFTLSRVCRRWRLVALETPILWSFLGDVRMNQKSGSKFGYSYTKFLEMVLRRSKTLDLWIYVYAAPVRELDTLTRHAIAPLVRHAGRWRVVTFETTPSVVAAFRGVQHRLPRLRSISLDLCLGGQEPNLNLFSDAPSLTEVTISGPSLLLELPWGQLKSFNEQNHRTGRSQLVHIFQNSRDSLEHFAITLRPMMLLYFLGETFSDTPITFPKLKTMRLTMTPSSVDLGVVVCFLMLPCLEELQLSSCPTQELVQLFWRSFQHSTRPPLKRLSLCGPASSHIVELLRLVPHLEHLELDLGVVHDALGEMAGINENNSPLLPELKSLVINWDPRRDAAAFVAFTTSRCKRTTTAREEDRARTVADITLTFPSRKSAMLVQGWLNNWRGCEAADVPKGNNSWWDILHFQLYAIREDKVVQMRPNFALDVNRTLTGIENLEPQEVNHIYASQLYVYLRNLSLSNKRQIPGDDKYHLRKRAKAIIERWDGIIQADITDANSCWRKNWVARGEQALRYLPDDYVFRDLSEAVELIFGARLAMGD